METIKSDIRNVKRQTGIIIIFHNHLMYIIVIIKLFGPVLVFGIRISIKQNKHRTLIPGSRPKWNRTGSSIRISIDPELILDQDPGISLLIHFGIDPGVKVLCFFFILILIPNTRTGPKWQSISLNYDYCRFLKLLKVIKSCKLKLKFTKLKMKDLSCA